MDLDDIRQFVCDYAPLISNWEGVHEALKNHTPLARRALRHGFRPKTRLVASHEDMTFLRMVKFVKNLLKTSLTLDKMFAIVLNHHFAEELIVMKDILFLSNQRVDSDGITI